MRKVMPGCFLGWNRVGFLARAIGFNGGVGYGGKVPQKVEKKKGFGGVFRNVGKKVLGVPGCRGLAGKIIAPGGGLFGMGGIVRSWVLTMKAGSCM